MKYINLKINFLRIYGLYFGVLIFSISPLLAQTGYKDMLQTLDCQPASTRAAAMGFAGVACGNSVEESRINPANLGYLPTRLVTEYGLSGPVFLDRNSNCQFGAFGFKVTKKLSVAMSVFKYRVLHPIMDVAQGNEQYNADKIAETHQCLTGSYNINRKLTIGINATRFVYYLKGLTSDIAYFGDAGVIYEPITKDRKNQKNEVHIQPKNKRVDESHLKFGASLTNINKANSAWIFPSGNHVQINIAQYFRIGGSYEISFSARDFVFGKSTMIPSENRTVDLLFQTQYLDFFNQTSKKLNTAATYYWGLNTGMELSFLKIVMFRAGYRYESRYGDNGNNANIINYNYLKGFTYGMGVKLPFHYLTHKSLPFDVLLDIYNKKAFKWLKEQGPLNSEYNTVNFSFRVNWYL